MLLAGASALALGGVAHATQFFTTNTPGAYSFTIPVTGDYQITLAGGGSAGVGISGPKYGGSSTAVHGDFLLTAGTYLTGVIGSGGTYLGGSAAGGESTIYSGATLLSYSNGSAGKYGSPAAQSYGTNVGSYPAGNDGRPGGDGLPGFVTISSAPEPATWTLMITGFGLLGYALRRRMARATLTA
jgi:hypothetical protein